MRKPSPVGQGRAILLLAALVCVCVSGMVAEEQKDSQLRTLTGHVFAGESQPLAKAIVYLKNTKTLAMKTYITEADGSYRFPALAVNVDYEVYADYQGMRSDTKTLSAFDNRKQV
ncbi:MAG TPA: carboxypeptidase-like regulatory domain-containing protein, partial [Candidatus Angelobacter sp.]|nr:carboxypeptidase-like regulatory domain-containing protein [Candidatus Angelobacter sp.]